MNEKTKQAAIKANIVAVEHRILTSYSDDRAAFEIVRTHNVTGAGMCGMCRAVKSAMEANATAAQ